MNRRNILAIFTFFLSVFLTLLLIVHAQAISPAPTDLTVSVTPLIAQQVSYTLPYPGLLPDNPLYPLKTLRDKIVNFFISDPVKKAEFDLLLSDKRVNASYYLYQQSKNKEGLIETTLSKAMDYFDQGIGQLRQAKMQGTNVHDSVTTFSTASQKYQEILMLMQTNPSNKMSQVIKSIKQRIANSQKSLAAFGSK